MKKYIKTGIYVITIIALLYYLYIKRENFLVFLQIEPLWIVFLFIAHFIPVYILAYIFKVNIFIFNLNLQFKEWFGITVSNTMYNYILPFRGGMAIKGVYLKKQFAFPYTKYVSYLSGFYLLNFTISSIIALITGSFLIYSSKISPSIYYIVIFIFVFFFFFFVIFFL